MIDRRLLYVPAGVVAIILVFTVVLEVALEDWFIKYSETELETTLDAAILSTIHRNPEVNRESLTDLLNHLPQVSPAKQLALIDASGSVIAATGLPTRFLEELDTQETFPEIQAAMEGGLGISLRPGDAEKALHVHVAKQIKFGEFSGVMRVSTPLSAIKQQLWDLQLLVSGIMVLSIAMIIALTIVNNLIIRKHMLEERERQEDRITARTREIEVLQRLATMLAACQSINEGQCVIEDIAPRLLPNAHGCISLIRSSRNSVETKFTWGLPWQGMSNFAPNECWALRKGKFHLSHGINTSIPCGHMAGVHEGQTLCVPLNAHGNTIGLMHLQFDDIELTRDFSSAFTVAEHLGLALANLRLKEDLQEQAIRDPLTGMYNRRFLDEYLGNELMRATRADDSLSFLMMDLDHFKRFNDNFGHDAGDYVLKSLAQLIKKTLRAQDVSCRIGGEEMAVILPGADRDAGMIVAGKMCEAVRNLHLEFRGSSLGPLSISIGVATFPQNSTDATELLKLADTALYYAKDQGRDRFCHIDSGELIDVEIEGEDTAALAG